MKKEKAINILISMRKDFQHALDDGLCENPDEDSFDAIESNREAIEALTIAIKSLSKN